MTKIFAVVLLLTLTLAAGAGENGGSSKLGESVAFAMAEFLGTLGKVVARSVELAAESMDFDFGIEGLVEGITASVEKATAELEEQLPTTIKFMVGAMLRVTADALANMNFEEMDFENAEGVSVPYFELSPEERVEVREAFRETAEALSEAASEFE